MKIIRNSKLIKRVRNFFGYKPAISLLNLNEKISQPLMLSFGELIIILKQF